MKCFGFNQTKTPSGKFERVSDRRIRLMEDKKLDVRRD